MYRRCIFCSADLGANEALEEFPVGCAVAFDARRGRLWAVCPRCARWNLAPLEARWEPVETAERLFRDARLRVQSENVGLARMPDGTRLIRVGEALPGELAAWRYGAELARRRRRWMVATGVVGAAAVAWGGLAVAGALGGAAGLVNVANLAWHTRQSRRVVGRVDADESPTGATLVLRRRNLDGARIEASDGGEATLFLPSGLDPERATMDDGRVAWLPERSLALRGDALRTVLSRAMVEANRAGASRRHLDAAVGLLADAGGAEAFVRRTAERGGRVGIGGSLHPHRRLGWRQLAGTFRGEIVPPPSAPRERRRSLLSGPDPDRLTRPTALALEMALHEERERRALEGELAALEAAWREAEEIAAIADALPDDPLAALKRRLAGRTDPEEA